MVIHRRRTVAEPSTGPDAAGTGPVTVSVEEEEGALGGTTFVVAPRAQPQVVSWWCPALPYPGGCSTIGAGGLSFRVRYGAGRGSPAMTTRTGLVGACPTVPAVPRVGGGGVVGACPVFCYTCRVPLRVRTVWCGPACVVGVGRGPYSGRPPPARGGWSVACSRVPDARSLACLLARVCSFVCCVGLLVPVSSTGHPASTPGLSTRSSTGGLPHHPRGVVCGGLVSGMVSRLDAFSGYPSRT